MLSSEQALAASISDSNVNVLDRWSFSSSVERISSISPPLTCLTLPARKVLTPISGKLKSGHNGLFARQFPIACTYLMYQDLAGFDRRRFDLFAIMQFV